MALLWWAVLCLVIAVAAAVLGFTGVARASAGIAKVLFFIFLLIAAVLLVAGLLGA